MVSLTNEERAPAGPPASRRRAANLLLEPALQLKLPGLLLGVTAGFALLQTAHVWLAYSRLYDEVLRQTVHPDAMAAILRTQTSDFLAASGVLAIGYALVVIAVAVAYAHRMVGPTVAFRRHVLALTEGDYASRVRLRRNDAFPELAQELNVLAATLEDDRK